MRIKATCDQFNITIPYNNNLEDQFVHFQAVKALVKKYNLDWNISKMVYGSDDNGYVFCFSNSVINDKGGGIMKISKGEYIVESVATTNLIEPSFLMEDENFINEARSIIKIYPDINDVIEHLNKWVNENY